TAQPLQGVLIPCILRDILFPFEIEKGLFIHAFQLTFLAHILIICIHAFFDTAIIAYLSITEPYEIIRKHADWFIVTLKQKDPPLRALQIIHSTLEHLFIPGTQMTVHITVDDDIRISDFGHLNQYQRNFPAWKISDRCGPS